MATIEAPVAAKAATGDKIDNAFRRVLGHLLWLAPAVLVLAIYYWRNYTHGFRLLFPDAMDMAQLARHIQHHEGFVTSFIRPLALSLQGGSGPQPELYQAPLFPLVLATLFATGMGARDMVVGMGSLIFHLASLVTVYALGRRLFGHAAGALAALLLALNPQLLTFAFSGLALPLALFLVTLGVLLIYRNPGSLRRSAWTGLVFGLAVLTEYACLWVALAAVVLAGRIQDRRRWLHALAFAMGLVVALLPWAYRNMVVAGNPFYTLQARALSMYTSASPGTSLLRTADPSLASLWSVGSLSALATKWIFGVKSLLEAAPLVAGLYLLPFLVVGLLYRLPDKRAILLRNWGVLTLLLQIALLSFFKPAPELLTPLVGVLGVLAAGYFTLMSASVSRVRALAALLGVSVIPLAAGLALARPIQPPMDSMGYLNRNYQPGAVVLTDIPWAVAWHTDLQAVWLPMTAKDYERIDKGGRVAGIYLSSSLPGYPSGELSPIWQQMYAGMNVVHGFVRQAAYPPRELIFGRSESSEK